VTRAFFKNLGKTKSAGKKKKTKTKEKKREEVFVSLQDLKKGPKIGSGAFGDVFEGLYAPEGQEEQRVVLKQYKALRGRDVRSFYEDELAACRRLFECDGVAEFLGVAGADVYLVWAYEGTVTLEALLQSGEGVVALAEVLGYEDPAEAYEAFAAGLLGAVMAMHSEGVVHRDIKPGNILLAQTDAGVEVKLIDLGGVADLTSSGLREEEAIFDPLYGAPEQYIEKRGLFGKSSFEATGEPPSYKLDTFSAGLVLLQLAVPALHSPQAYQSMRNALHEYGCLEAWRESEGAKTSCDFSLLDLNKGQAWTLLTQLADFDPDERISLFDAFKTSKMLKSYVA